MKSPETERRAALGEIRVEGRKLTGTVVRYGEVSPSHRERFAPGSIRMADVVHLDIGHDRERAVAWRPGGGLELADQGRGARVDRRASAYPSGGPHTRGNSIRQNHRIIGRVSSCEGIPRRGRCA